ncbi:MAG: DJ-1/PfpI family protein [Gammaproteobacteria bacterium]|jgi:4-methyl-5(b-hydroxyethyl)-thiazole monophosphate biosynthesis|nr:DJ-1/PfpI family protein [Gammaproteobacteria bacterium]MDH3935161.1 DJ-1/PfpI family protein [Gammaproteobacteria bacterium]MDH3971190.1 DJ-1/PfpI family protein [Gammaproteobacteria bacterium]MDH3986242.1 DJ-1/PfpI family protein [Gammaproteobacteria bacterium]
MASVLVPLAQGCEELEAVTVVDLLRRAGINVVTAGLDAQPVKASRGMTLLPDMTLDMALQQRFDMVVLPGGLPGADHLGDDPRVIRLLQEMAASESYIAAICAAPRVLARAGLLDGKRATSYPGALDIEAVPGIEYLETAVVTDGRVITSRGPGTAMDFALVLIETLLGKTTRDEVEAGLQRG